MSHCMFLRSMRSYTSLPSVCIGNLMANLALKLGASNLLVVVHFGRRQSPETYLQESRS